MYKYTFITLIRQLPYERYKTAIQDMANLCQVSQSTVRRWVYQRKNEPFDISFCQIMTLADYFNVQPKNLYHE